MEKNKETAEGKERQELQRLYAETVPYLLQWYDYNRRILPWREDPTPYHVWVSEIMLQQTRVEAVKGYYDRFLTCLPDIAALAAAEEEVLLKLWEGLGYYNRVRNMQKAARVIMEAYGGEMPADYEGLRALPGIGDYTAGAIASIAFGRSYPAVDGNVLRVMSRIACSEEDITKEQTRRKLKEDLTFAIPKRSGDFNQSLMELGATVCLPNGKPLCEQCPVMHLCKAFHAGRETELPVKTGPKARRMENRAVYLVFYDGKVLLHRREKKGLLAGLWEFPNILIENGKNKMTPAKAKAILEELMPEGVECKAYKGQKAKHIFSHVEWHMEGIRIEVDAKRPALNGMTSEERQNGVSAAVRRAIRETMSRDAEDATEHASDWAFVTLQEVQETYPIPSAFEAYLKELKQGTRSEAEK